MHHRSYRNAGKYLRFILLVFVMSLCVDIVSAQQYTTCDWPEEAPEDCNEVWSAALFQDVWIQVSTPPPCSVKVRASYRKRCLQIEVIEFNYIMVGNNYPMSPPNCKSNDFMNSYIVSDVGFIKDIVYDAIATNVMNVYVATHGGTTGGGACCPCPNMKQLVEAKIGACADLYLNYQMPIGPPVELRFDPSLPWASYVSSMQAVGGYDPVVSMRPCFGEACCYRNREFCVSSGVITFVDGPWLTVGDCEVASEPCDIVVCPAAQ